MAATDGIASHVFQLYQLSVERIFVEGRSQASEVVVVTNAVDFQVLSIQPKTGFAVKLEIAEARNGEHLINNLIV